MNNPFRNLFAKKDKRKIPLLFVHQFKSGEKLYTYNKEHYGTIASRYWYALNKALNYLTMYGQDERSVKNALDTLQATVQDMTLGNNIKENGFKANTTIEFMKTYVYSKTSLQLKYHEVLFCMFYLLEDEVEGGYSDLYNEKKLALINADEQMRDVFFSTVQSIADSLSITLETTSQQLIIQTVSLLNQKPNIQ